MKTKVRDILLFSCMVALLIGGLLWVAVTRGWFDSVENGSVARPTQGICSLERYGMINFLEEETALRDGDVLHTESEAEILVKLEESSLYLSGRSALSLADGAFALDNGEACVFAGKQPLLLQFDKQLLRLQNCTLAVNNNGKIQTLFVLSGSVFAGEEEVTRGKQLCAENGSHTITSFSADFLSDFMLKKFIDSGETLCLSEAAMQSVLDARHAERLRALESLSPTEASSIETAQTQPTADTAAEPATAEASAAAAPPSPAQPDTPARPTPAPPAAPTQPSEQPTAAPTEQTQADTESPTQPEENVMHCTITIRCDSILENKQLLAPGKDVYVPADGVILPVTSVAIDKGESVLDVLRSVCYKANIPLICGSAPVYVSSINHISEFDCGEQSGWLYKVNGVLPSWDCGSYILTEADAVEFVYTCNGLGW